MIVIVRRNTRWPGFVKDGVLRLGARLHCAAKTKVTPETVDWDIRAIVRLQRGSGRD